MRIMFSTEIGRGKQYRTNTPCNIRQTLLKVRKKKKKNKRRRKKKMKKNTTKIMMNIFFIS